MNNYICSKCKESLQICSDKIFYCNKCDHHLSTDSRSNPHAILIKEKPEVLIKMNTEKRELKMGIYKHYKGKLYLVIGTAQHSETQEKLVVYVPLYEHTGEPMSVRPIEMFLSTVMIEVDYGVDRPRGYTEVRKQSLIVNRFEYVGNFGSWEQKHD